jgi:putative glutamine amidotransferase
MSSMPSPVDKPVVLVPACNRMRGDHPIHSAGKKYVDGVRLAGCLPLIVPSAEVQEIDELLSLADGVLLTGSPSNVHPSHFGEPVHDPSLPLDPLRDGWTLPLVREALRRGVPLFGLCRGAQEVNVALGGSLHQAVQELDGHLDHRSDDDDPVDKQYGLVHQVQVEPGGVLASVLQRERFEVNSLHGQAVNRLADGLRIEARAPDGVIEAFSMPGGGFNLSVQWHPEWQAADNPVSTLLFKAFGAACRAWRERRIVRHPQAQR